jgi:peptide/nickel transport system permease protein
MLGINLFPVKQSKNKASTLWIQAYYRLKKNKFAIGGFIFLVFMFIFSFIGPFFSPYVIDIVNVTIMNQPPSPAHWLGTDNFGRDILTRLMLAGKVSLTVGMPR